VQTGPPEGADHGTPPRPDAVIDPPGKHSKMTITLRHRLVAGLWLCASATTALAVPERATLDRTALLAQLSANTAGALFDSATVAPGTASSTLYRMLGSRGGAPLMRDDAGAAPLARAQAFLSIYGPLMGITDPVAQLRAVRSSRDAAGNTHVHLDQTVQGVPVLAARLVVHMNGTGITGVSGTVIPGLESFSVTPGISEIEAGLAAVQLGSKRHAGNALKVESSRLIVYRSDLLDGHHDGHNYLAYEVVVTAGPSTGIRERYILDASNGAAINRIDGIQTVLNRAIHTGTEAQPAVLTEGGPGTPSDLPLVNDDRTKTSSRTAVVPPGPLSNLYIFAGGTYALYKNMFGRAGYDDGYIDPVTGMPKKQIQNSTYLVNEQCPNAYWDGVGTNYCPDFDADDVVSHEWSHAYTEYTHGLYYQWQAGALNEAYSDIFGETYDLVNGIEGVQGATLTEGDYHENGGSRWVVGEDLGEAVAEVLLRDMWDPDNFDLPTGQPSPLGAQAGKVTSPNYSCTGEPHANSGIPNHAYAMLVDGKTWNNVTIKGIGIVKAAHIYFQAETHYQIPSTNFAQHADALEAACHDLIGVDLNDPTGKVSADRITPADCDAVHATTVATELRTSDKAFCKYSGTLLKDESTTPALCKAGTYETPDFSENWEGGKLPAGWVATQTITGDSKFVPNWIVTNKLPAPHTGYAVYREDYNHGGSPNSGGDSSSHSTLDSPEITIADDQSYLKFTHYILSEGTYDGGNVKYSVNGAAFAIIPATAMTYNPYNTTLSNPPPTSLPISDPTGLTGNNTNPIAGQAAYAGTDNGENSSEWGTTIVDLKTLGLKKGDKVKFRWDFGQDATGGDYGWIVDDLSVAHCGLTAPVNSGGGGGTATGGGTTTGGTGTVTSSAGNATQGRFGGGAVGALLMLPFLAAGLLGRKRRA
jgi:bacillolysin